MKLPGLEDVVNRPGMAVGAPGVRANAEALSSHASAYLGRIGDTALDVSANLKAEQRRAEEKRDAVAAQKVVTETNFAWAKHLMEAQQNAPEGAAGFGAQVSGFFEQDLQERMALIPESARDWAQGQFNAMAGDYGLKALDFEHDAGQAKQLTDLGDIADMNANGVRGDFGQFDGAMARTTAAIEASGLNAAAKAKARATAQETIAISGLQGLNERDPERAKKMLAAGGFDAILSPKNKDALLGAADLEIKRRQDEVERRQRQAEADRRAAVADVRERGRFLMAALESGVVPAYYDDTIKELQTLGDDKTATAMQLAKGDVQWTQDALKMSPAELQAEIDRHRAAIATVPDAVIAADLAGKVKAGEKILDEKTKVEIAGIRDEATDALAAIPNGFDPTDLIARAELAGDKSTAQVLRLARNGQGQAVELAKLAPAELRKRLDSMGEETGATGDAQWAATQAQREARGEKLLANMNNGLREDPLSWAESVGNVKPTDLYGAIATAANGDASGLPAALQARQQANAQVAARYPGVQPELLKPAEAKAIVGAFSGAKTADQKMAIVAAVSALPVDQAGMVADQLMREKGGEDFGRVLGVALDDPAAARDILAGQEAKANVKGTKAEDSEDLRGALSDQLGNLLRANPVARGAIEQNALDVYSQLTLQAGDTTGSFDPDRMKTAIDRVTGGVITYGSQTILPPAPGMTEAGFGDMLDRIDGRYLQSQMGASRTGAQVQPVYRNGVSLTADDLRRVAEYQSAGKTSYFVLIDGEPVRDARTGRPFTIDFADLINPPKPSASTTDLPSAAGMRGLGLTQQEQFLYQWHVNNVTGRNGGKSVKNADGSTSTVLQRVVEGPGGRFYNVPSVWDGKIHDSERAAIEHAAKVGWDKWPSYATPEEADRRYMQMHEFMEADVP